MNQTPRKLFHLHDDFYRLQCLDVPDAVQLAELIDDHPEMVFDRRVGVDVYFGLSLAGIPHLRMMVPYELVRREVRCP